MRAVFVEVADVVPSKANGVARVEYDDVIEELTAAPTDPPLSYGILPGAAIGNAARPRAHRLDEADHSSAENRVAVEEEMPRRSLEGEGLSQLLDDPGGGGIEGGVEVKDPPTLMVDDEPAIPP